MTPPRLHRALEASFDELSARVPATIGVAIAYPDEVRSLGHWSVGVAWSTIKVPLAIAALRNEPSRPDDLVVKAISQSDNVASESLWSQLGEPTDAARQVQAVLRECGDSTTIVESRRLRACYTAFGQTQWALRDQARFAANLASVPDAAVVINLMKRLVAEQQWGLAAKGIAAKGGWGPGVEHGYLVRQFGILPTELGMLGVAIAAEADSFQNGVSVLNTLTEWLFSHFGGPPNGTVAVLTQD
ncbi:hypothetical protein BST27_17560 [Mycobacterium intermedium]|uniref:Beta-lactamase class A catalytic domain-containing protein n=1 Tax=Mycobacterium intermedium TaxID=28445 RepID=A0A1E3S9Z6_MYCIE|nr:serine hydrolase [Mycobacterium intermedium]MCV6966327.1 hypothetical protein [Mycobacterium intermedium]ODQ98397.1 hypothetical protein BHQ20_22080 [Mycobacterium intermedium]OPE45683.1 hypothetical protein BV508_28725 [Mycobacterium intermedium]ORB01516.1 hypothetical protein BST27_17560 [Mycobacterium intermedium]